MRGERELAREQHQIWNRIAPFWDSHVSSGELSAPPPMIDGLLELRPGTTLLDVGCGNGRFARYAASKGVLVTAVDASPVFIEIARSRPSDGIDYMVLDATNEVELGALGEDRFDAAIANMVLMNLATIAPLASALGRALVPGGVFVASVPHPCFPWAFTVDTADGRGRWAGWLRAFALAERVGRALPPTVTRRLASAVLPVMRARKRPYLTPVARKMMEPGQPVPHYNFHRPLHILLEPFFEAGFVLDALREPLSTQDTDAGLNAEIPGILVSRLRWAR